MDERDILENNPFVEPAKDTPKKQSVKKSLAHKLSKIKNRTITETKKRLKIKKTYQLVFSFVFVILISIISFNVTLRLNSRPKTNQTAANSQTATITKLENKKPELKLLVPAGKTIDQLGGWSKISLSSGDIFYQFADSIDQITIKVGQQKLPESYKDNTESKLLELAKSISANEKVLAGSTEFYIFTSPDKTHAQLITLVKNNLLISISSTAKVSNEAWINYINSLN